MSRTQGPHDVDRDVPEFLQEVRVAQTGGQIFFAFLFTIAFSPGFDALNDGQQTLYLVTLLVVASSIVVLITPVAVHQWNFGMRMRREWLVATHFLASVGLVLLGAGLVMAVVMVVQVVRPDGWWLPVALGLIVLALWIGLPLVVRAGPVREALRGHKLARAYDEQRSSEPAASSGQQQGRSGDDGDHGDRQPEHS